MARTARVLSVCARFRVAILALLIPFFAMSQTDRGTITGTVAGALVPGAGRPMAPGMIWESGCRKRQHRPTDE